MPSASKPRPDAAAGPLRRPAVAGYRLVDFATATTLVTESRVQGSRRWTRVASGVVLLVLLAAVGRWVISNPAFEWDVFASYFFQPRILRGVWTTIWLTAAVVGISVVFGLGLAALRLSRVPALVAFAWGYVWVFRSIPVLVQLLLWFNIGYFVPTFTVTLPTGQVLSVATNDLVTATGAAILGLSLHGVAVAGEIIRGGFLAVPHGQTEAARVLGFSGSYIFRRVIFPQSLRSIVPALANMFIEQLKGTSIVSVLAVRDLLYSVQEIYASNYKVFPLLMVATVWYVIVTSLLSVAQYLLEKRLARSAGRSGRTLPVRPVTPGSRDAASAAGPRDREGSGLLVG